MRIEKKRRKKRKTNRKRKTKQKFKRKKRKKTRKRKRRRKINKILKGGGWGGDYDSIITFRKTINGKPLIFVLEKICHKGTITPTDLSKKIVGAQRWRDFMNQRITQVRMSIEDMIFFNKQKRVFESLYNKNQDIYMDVLRAKGMDMERYWIKSYINDDVHIIIPILKEWALETGNHNLKDKLNTKEMNKLITLSKFEADRYVNYGNVNLPSSIGPHVACLNYNCNEFIDTWIVYIMLEEDWTNFNLDPNPENFLQNDAKILMAMTAAIDISQELPYQYHMGIHRSLHYLGNKHKAKLSKGAEKATSDSIKGSGLGRLSLLLHGFTSQALDKIYGSEQRLIISDPLDGMAKIIKESGLVEGEEFITYPTIKQQYIRYDKSNKDIFEELIGKLPAKRLSKAIQPNEYEVVSAQWFKISPGKFLQNEEPIYLFFSDSGCVTNAWNTFASKNTAFNKLFK
tara:strand:+ start:1229 stop:2599 length:1371 start_codon:yes stop_codon:yes gene_type:complete